MQITELAAKIQPLGLTDKEARVYVASLFLGPSPVQKIAQQAEINRATTYVILAQLAQLGLVAESTEGKKTMFVAEPPQTLQRLFDRQITEVENRRKELDTILPELTEIQRAESAKAPVVRFYKGREGVAGMRAELQRKAKAHSTGYALVNYDEVEKILPGFLKMPSTARINKKINANIIYSYRKDVPADKKQLRDTRKVDSPVLADISLYEGIAALSTYAGNDTIGIIIESEEIVGALRQLFELAWQNQDHNSK